MRFRVFNKTQICLMCGDEVVAVMYYEEFMDMLRRDNGFTNT